jgi:hypothetical protein
MPLIYTYDAEMDQIVVPSVQIAPGTFTLTHIISLRAPTPDVPRTAEQIAASDLLLKKQLSKLKRSEAAKKAWSARRAATGLWLA